MDDNFILSFDTIAECQQYLEERVYPMDIAYMWVKTKEECTYIRIKRLVNLVTWILILLFIIRVIPFSWNLISIIIIIYASIGTIYALCRSETDRKIEKEFTDRKVRLAWFYFSKYKEYHGYPEWVRNQIFREHIAPYAGLKFSNEE